ncbi:MAG: alpha/beta hydrolase [Verrucomicrobiota bacterium]
MWRIILLLLAAACAGFAALTAWRAPNLATWKLALLAGEFGHFLGLAPAVVLVLAWRHGAVGLTPALLRASTLLLGVAALGLLLKPAVQARALARRLPEMLTVAFGPQELARAPFSIAGMLPDLSGGPVSVEQIMFARAGTTDALALDFYHAVRTDGRAAPCVVIIHGGGWDSGDRAQLAGFNRWLAQRGYAVAAMDYRLAPKDRWPAQADDVADALAHLKATAGPLGLDPQKFVLLGRSAGGQIATAFAYGRPDPAVRGVVALYAPHDLNFAWQYGREDDILHSLQLLRNYLGGPPDENTRAAYDSGSAWRLATPSSPATLLVHGALDTLVWHRQSERLHTRLDEIGVPNVFVSLPWATHAFDWNLGGPGGQLTTFALEWFLAAVTK